LSRCNTKIDEFDYNVRLYGNCEIERTKLNNGDTKLTDNDAVTNE
jgi:hypothetical protein